MNPLTEDKLKGKDWTIHHRVYGKRPTKYDYEFLVYINDKPVLLQSSTASGITKKIKKYLTTI